MAPDQNPKPKELAAFPLRERLAPADYLDPVIEEYKKHVDRSLLRENLKLSVEERFERAHKHGEFLEELRRAGQWDRG